MGGTVTLAVETRGLHFFDPETGLTLRAPRASSPRRRSELRTGRPSCRRVAASAGTRSSEAAGPGRRRGLQGLDRRPGDLVDGLLDRRQRRLRPCRCLGSVEADDREVVRDAKAEGSGLLHGADGHQVVGADDGGGAVAVRPLHDRSQRAPASVDRESRIGDVSPGVDPRGRQRLLPATVLLTRREGKGLAGDEADPPMTQLQQVLGRHSPGRALVDADGRDRKGLRCPVDEHEAGALLQELPVVRVLAADVGDLRANEHHPLDTTLEQHVHVVDLAHRRAGRVADDRGEPGCGRSRLHCLGERGEDRVAELGHQQAYRAARLGATRHHVEQVAHGALDALARLGTDGSRAARDTRGGRDTNSGAVCDVSKTCHLYILMEVRVTARCQILRRDTSGFPA